jgi:selenocysteine lyase/cysteine desulfurase
MRAYVAAKLHCPTKNIYLVQNATDAMNCMVKSLKWAEGDIVLLPNTAYGSFRKTIAALKDRYNITVLDVS